MAARMAQQQKKRSSSSLCNFHPPLSTSLRSGSGDRAGRPGNPREVASLIPGTADPSVQPGVPGHDA
ncbi:unnamed protein product [Boreogadus saida]